MNLLFANRAVSIMALLIFCLCPNARGEESSTPKVGAKAVDFTLDDLGGKSVSLSEVVKSGPVVLVVLRGWPGYQCPLCTRQVGEFLGHAKEFKGAGATVVMVYPGPADQLKEHAKEFFKDKDISDTFRLLTDPDFKFTKAYGLRWDAPNETAYPSTFVIGRESIVSFAKVSKAHGGRASATDVLKAIADVK
jgi:peroxiredoxin Q/BCP